MEQEYNNYIDISEVVMNYYQNTPATGLEKHFIQIEDWLKKPVDDDHNYPFVIQADEGVGKKTLLVKWIEHHQNLQGNKDIIIPHFATTGGNNSNYYFAIYRILTKLRELLGIEQKVELLEEKLRKYFQYWLEVCNKNLENQILQEKVTQDESLMYNRIILIFEGIHQFFDNDSGQEASVAFWLPRVFPGRIKIICTADAETQAFQYFQKLNCQIMHISVSSSVIEDIYAKHLKKKILINEELKNKILEMLQNFDKSEYTTLFLRTLITVFLPESTEFQTNQEDIKKFDSVFQKLELNKLKETTDVNSLYHFIINFFQQHLMIQKRFDDLMLTLAITQKGLTTKEIKLVTGCTENEFKVFMIIFKSFAMKYKDFWILNNNIFQKAIFTYYESSNTAVLHEKIADVLDKHTPNSIRKLEEETYNLFKAKSYFKLKEVVSKIENFLLLFNPNNKFDLCRYWQQLEVSSFDPVIEYNKAIEGFEMHFHPSSEDIFRIIVQISRFLKEFSDFETYLTPKFRHPPIKGNQEELQEIGLLNELVQLDIYDLENRDIEEVKANMQVEQKDFQEKLDEKMSKVFIDKKKKKDRNCSKFSSVTAQQDYSKAKKQIKPRKQILNQIESLNLEIPQNIEKFRNFYLDYLDKFIIQEDEDLVHEKNNKKKEINKKEQQPRNSVHAKQISRLQSINQDIKEKESKKKDQEKKAQQLDKLLEQEQEHTSEKIKYSSVQEDYYLNQQVRTNYYYKRWMWVQFPWICISLKSDYSEKLEKCFSSETQYMTIEEEKNFTQQALEITIKAKKKKQQMLQGKPANMKAHNNNNSQSVGYLPKINNTTSSQNQNKKKVDESMFFLTEEYLSQSNLNNNLDISNINKVDSSDYQDNNKFKKKRMGQSLNRKELEQEQSQTIGASRTKQILATGIQSQPKSLKMDIKQSLENLQQSNNFSVILPRLKGSINNHTQRELSILSQQTSNFQREYDQITYKNKLLAHKYKELKIKEKNLREYSFNQDKIQQLSNKNDGLSNNIKETEVNYVTSIMQIDRLQIVLKLCEENKKQNNEWITQLNYLINNFEKMINYEKNGVAEIEGKIQNINEIHKKYKDSKHFTQKDTQKLIDHVTKSINNKLEFDSMYYKSQGIIENKANETIDQQIDQQKVQNRKKKEGQKKKQLFKNNNEWQEKYEQLQINHSKVCEKFDITDDKYQQTKEFQQLVANIEKKSELLENKFNLQNQISDLEQSLQKTEFQLNTIRKANEIQKQKDLKKKQTQEIEEQKEIEEESEEYEYYISIDDEKEEAKEEVKEQQAKEQEEQNEEKSKKDSTLMEKVEDFFGKGSESEKEENKENEQDKEQEQSKNLVPEKQQEKRKRQKTYSYQTYKRTDSPITKKSINQLQSQIENKHNQNEHLKQSSINCFMVVNTILKKLNLPQMSEMKQLYTLDYHIINQKIQEIIQWNQENIPEEDKEKIQNGTYDFDKVFKFVERNNRLNRHNSNYETTHTIDSEVQN